MSTNFIEPCRNILLIFNIYRSLCRKYCTSWRQERCVGRKAGRTLKCHAPDSLLINQQLFFVQPCRHPKHKLPDCSFDETQSGSSFVLFLFTTHDGHLPGHTLRAPVLPANGWQSLFVASRCFACGQSVYRKNGRREDRDPAEVRRSLLMKLFNRKIRLK